MTTIPCLKDKCLKLPVCKHKSTIQCTALNDYLHTVLPNASNTIEYNYLKYHVWKHLNKTLPKATQAYIDSDLSYPSHLRARHTVHKFQTGKELYDS